MKKWIRIKRLVNDGELSKAAQDIDGAGVATPTKEIVDELRVKYPKRKEEVKWPTNVEIITELVETAKADKKFIYDNAGLENYSSKEESKLMDIDVMTAYKMMMIQLK